MPSWGTSGSVGGGGGDPAADPAIYSRQGNRCKDGKPGRKALLAIRYSTFALQPLSTHRRRKELAASPVQAVWVVEENPPTGTKPVQWLLLTTLPITSFEDAPLPAVPPSLHNGDRLSTWQSNNAW